MKQFDKKLLKDAFEYLGELLDKNGMQCKICIYGGSALIFLSDFRKMSYDVDYRIIEINGNSIIDQRTKNVFSNLVFDVADKMGFDIDWMNRAVEIFVSENEDYSYTESFFNNALTLLTPSLECLLAMKCIAMRNSCDVGDIKYLIKKIGLSTPEEIVETVRRFFPMRQISLERLTQIDEICRDIANAVSSQHLSHKSCAGE